MTLDGTTRIGATLFQELRNAVFASVAQKAIRGVARNVFEHLLRLDLNFHLTRQTGGLTRAIDRGTKGISFLLTSMVFHVFPTALEISMVCGILVGKLVSVVFEEQQADQLRLTNMVRDLLPSQLQPCSHIPPSLFQQLPGEQSSENKLMLLTTKVRLLQLTP